MIQQLPTPCDTTATHACMQSRCRAAHLSQRPSFGSGVLVYAEEHGEGGKEVDGIEERAHGVHPAFVHKGVVGKLWDVGAGITKCQTLQLETLFCMRNMSWLASWYPTCK